MATKQELRVQYKTEHDNLEAEYYDIIIDGNGQHVALKPGKDIEEFKTNHSQVWQGHRGRLIAEGFPDPNPIPVEPQPTELDILKSNVQALGARLSVLEAKNRG